MIKKKQDAYMTVEGTFIIPVSFLLILSLLYVGLFCYEKSVSVQCCYLAALRGSNEWELTGNQLERFAEETLKQLLEEKCLKRVEAVYEIKTTGGSVTIQAEDRILLPFSPYVGKEASKWDICSEKTAIRNKPSTYIRKYQTVKE